MRVEDLVCRVETETTEKQAVEKQITVSSILFYNYLITRIPHYTAVCYRHCFVTSVAAVIGSLLILCRELTALCMKFLVCVICIACYIYCIAIDSAYYLVLLCFAAVGGGTGRGEASS